MQDEHRIVTLLEIFVFQGLWTPCSSERVLPTHWTEQDALRFGMERRNRLALYEAFPFFI